MEFNALPSTHTPYGIRNGKGPRHLIGGMVASTYATGAETDGAFCLHMLTGGKGAGLPVIRHGEAFTSLYVMEGAVELTIGSDSFALIAGDTASIPPGTDYGFRMTRHRTVTMIFQTGGTAGRLFAATGAPYEGFIQPATDPGKASDLAGHAAPPGTDTEIVGPLPDAPELLLPGKVLPDSAAPYVIESGEGERLVVADQIFTFAGRNPQTDGRFLTLFNEGPQGDMIPPHKHLRHDEMFLCLDGTIRMKAGDEILELNPGDWLFVPRGTPHAFQFTTPYCRTLGWLIPGIFEDFFFTLGDPYEGHVYPQEPGPFRFDRVIAKLDELDIVPLGGPPGAPPKDGTAT
ncbi:cupin domain-containing protein [Paracoccus aurantiacus]|nr:cupin domain-containing protein [Paracoccus aurantiacus]